VLAVDKGGIRAEPAAEEGPLIAMDTKLEVGENG